MTGHKWFKMTKNGRKMLENRVSDPEIDEIGTFGTCQKCTECVPNIAKMTLFGGPKMVQKEVQKWTKNGPKMGPFLSGSKTEAPYNAV